MQQTTSIYESRPISVRLPFTGRRLAELPITVWGLIGVAAAFALGGLMGFGLPRPIDPNVGQLQIQLAAASSEARDLRSETELREIEVARLRQIHDFSSEFRIPANLATQVYDIALAEGIDPDLGFKLIRVESAFRRRAVSTMNAIGYTQIRPATAKWLDPTVQTADLFDAQTNLHLGFRYLRYLLDEYNGDTRLALLAYNRGPGRVGTLLSSGVDPANGYARAVLGE